MSTTASFSPQATPIPTKPKPQAHTPATQQLEYQLAHRRAILQRVNFLRKQQADLKALTVRIISKPSLTPDALVSVILHLLKMQVESNDNEMRSWGQINSDVERRNGLR